MAIDKADWHSGGEFPANLPPENGGTHIGMFVAWAILHNLQGQFHDVESPTELAAVRNRTEPGASDSYRCRDRYGSRYAVFGTARSR